MHALFDNISVISCIPWLSPYMWIWRADLCNHREILGSSASPSPDPLLHIPVQNPPPLAIWCFSVFSFGLLTADCQRAVPPAFGLRIYPLQQGLLFATEVKKKKIFWSFIKPVRLAYPTIEGLSSSPSVSKQSSSDSMTKIITSHDVLEYYCLSSNTHISELTLVICP